MHKNKMEGGKTMKKFLEGLKKSNAGFIMGILFTLYGISYFVLSFAYPYVNKFGMGPGFFPRWIAVLSIIAGICYTLMSLFRDKFITEEVFPNGKELLNVLTVVLSILVYILIIKYVGFLVSSTLLLFVIFIRSYKWPKALVFALVASVIVFGIFKLGFKVPIPVNMFGF